MNGKLEVDAPAGALTNMDISHLRHAKVDLIRTLNLANGLEADEAAKALMELEEFAPEEIETCPVCDDLCDVQTSTGSWKCSSCDPEFESRKNNTDNWLGLPPNGAS
ncbi:hypothetical protein RE6C_03212 [Rhodopirellula europaea 6C]|uniref:Uncharacterized protein n=1 Tax=Rhodopirellula europaea 6C TaxID=1263867 RepID=M2A668_9BACT|nr:hypothetical protein RE6C_03212 [Rhodopirellula europaea 6C]